MIPRAVRRDSVFMNSETFETLQPSGPWQEYAAIFRALAHPARVAVLQVIRSAPRGCCPGPSASICACDIGKALGLSASMVSHHLRELRLARLIRTEKRGQWVHCSANPDALALIGRFARDDGAVPCPEEVR